MNEQQLSIFDDDLPTESIDFESTVDTERDKPPERPELLTIRLFKEAIKKENEGDRILEKFADHVLPNLIRQLVGCTAKGGQFTENRKAEGKNVERSKHDQSLTAHLLNGLFPTYRILKALQKQAKTNQVQRLCIGNKDIEALYIVSYILHDFDKFPDYQSWLVADGENRFLDRIWKNQPAKKEDAQNFARSYIVKKILDFELDKLFDENWRDNLDDIVWLTHNAGDKYDRDDGMEVRGLKPKLDGRERGTLSRLVRMADLFASMIKYPIDITSDGKSVKLPELLLDLSAGQLKFTYHSLSDNRGVLTNILNNALMDAHPKDDYTPLLFLPDGVVYLAKSTAIEINTDQIPDQVIAKIRSLCAGQLKRRQTGFGRDGKGFKFADYYWLFFDSVQLMQVSVSAASKLIPITKVSSAKKRGDSLAKAQAAGELPDNLDLDFPDNPLIDRLAEFGDTLCRGIWREWCDRANNWQKQQPKTERKALPELDLTEKLAEVLDLANEMPIVKAIQSLKKTGGVPLDWYYLAAQYLRKHPDLDDNGSRQIMEVLTIHAAELIRPIYEEFTFPDGWDDLRTYVSRSISLPSGAVIAPQPDSFLVEMGRYKAAKVVGRGRENVCAMSSSAYTVSEQMESATLFAPQVYSNRQILFNAQAAKRQICSIWSIEIMLRQILMNQTNSTGGDFEGRKYRYLYLYPTYFFTPETNKFLQKAYSWIARTRFDADIRKHLISENQVAKFEIANYQSIDSLLITENLNPEDDRTFKMLGYPDDQPLTFFFLALPPSRDATDTESWVMPSWLAMALPLILDVKTVVSESPVPPFISGADFEETALLDGEHQAIRSLIKRDRIRLDAIIPKETTERKFSPLNALSAAYCIHLEVNRKKDGDPDWGKLSALARDLETSPLFVFHYLNVWLRKQDRDTVPIQKIKLYLDLYYYLDPEGKDVNQLRKLTQLYRTFYRAKSQYAKANAVLKPIDEAADIIIKFNKDLANDTESLTYIVGGKLAQLMTNVRRGTAEGKPTLTFVDGKWKPALTIEQERQAIYEFSQFFVKEIFEGAFKGDRSRLAGTQLNLIRGTCDYLYRLEDDRERQERKVEEPSEIPEILEAEITA
jgi:CRISPR-associated protein Csc3